MQRIVDIFTYWRLYIYTWVQCRELAKAKGYESWKIRISKDASGAWNINCEIPKQGAK